MHGNRGWVAAATVAAFGVYGVYFRKSYQEQENTTIALEHTKYGIPSDGCPVRHNEGFSVAVDTRLRVPKWVLEHLTVDKLANKVTSRKNSNFSADPTISVFGRAVLDAYRFSGYDRGHMVAAADVKWTEEGMASSFLLSNVAPQVHSGMNAGYWERMERYGRMLTQEFDDVYVMSGPLFLPSRTGDGIWETRHDWIGNAPNLVAVPTHFYKVYLCVGSKKRSGNYVRIGDVAVASMVVPNRPIDDGIPLETFLVPLHTLQYAIGHELFPDAPWTPIDLAVVDARAELHREARGRRWTDLDTTNSPQRLIDNETKRVRVATGSHFLPPSLFPNTISSTISASLPEASGFGANRMLFHLCDATKCQLPKPYRN